MKRTLIKVLSMILIFAAILPLVVACNDDPPPDNGPNNNPGQPQENFYMEIADEKYDTTTLVNFDSSEYLSAYPVIAQNITGKEDQTVYKFETDVKQSVSFAVPEASRYVNDRFYVEFSVYTERKIELPLSISLGTQGVSSTSISIPLNFVGRKNFRVMLDNFTQATPFPSVESVTFAVSAPIGTIYISSVVATEPNFTLSVPEGVDINDPSLYSGIIDAYRGILVGNQGGSSSAEYAAKVDILEQSCINAWKNSEESFEDTFEAGVPNTLFGYTTVLTLDDDGNVTNLNGGSIWFIYENILAMAKGYGAYGSEYYHNTDLLSDIKKALEYCYEFYYGKHIAETGKTYGNWWEWDIGIPKALIGTVVIIKDQLTQDEIVKYLSPFDKILRYPTGTACNLIDMTESVLISAALQNDAKRICTAKKILEPLFLYTDENEDPETLGDGGFMTDGSFIQHGSIAYTGSYGHDLIIALGKVTLFMGGTRFALRGDTVNNQYRFVLENYRPFIFESCFTASLFGRATNRLTSEREKLTGIVAGMIMLSVDAPSEYKTDIQSVIRTVMRDMDYDFTSFDYTPLSLIDYCVSLKNDDSIPYSSGSGYAQIFSGMARAVQHTPEYGVCIAMSSTKISKYEALRNENATGWYHGDGMIYIYTDGYDHSSDFFLYANPLLMPGTTVNNSVRKATSETPVFNGSDYAGGASQGKYAAVGYILCYDEGSIRNTFGKVDDSKISAYKSYFMFDNEIICVGSRISDISGTGVRTVVDNRLWRESDVLSINGSPESSPVTVETVIDARTVHFTNMGGYVFFDDDMNTKNTITYSKATHDSSINTGSISLSAPGTRDFLELSISHGDGNVSNGRYYYAYLPEMSAEKTASYATNPDVILLEGKKDVHAVLEKTLGVVACNFFAPDDAVEIEGDNTAYTPVRRIEADTYCSVIISTSESGQTTISLSDPTSTYSSTAISVTLDSVSEIVSADSALTWEIKEGNRIEISANFENASGRTFSITVK